ncbi:MAG: DUF3822 family protein [Bacteroidales bacterium]|nr:DUF3822 family protein [Bacteroidales bacterium]
MPGKIVCVFEKYDKALNEASIEKYELSIQVALDGFSFCIFDTEKNKFMALGNFSNHGFTNETNYNTEVKTTIDQHKWLSKNQFHHIRVLFETPTTTLIPIGLFDTKEMENIASFNYKNPGNYDVHSDLLKNTGAYILYHTSDSLFNTFNDLYPGCKINNQAGVLIEILLVLFKNQPESKRVFVNVRSTFLDIVITEGKKLLFYNSFKYSSPNDFIYYLIFVIEQLNLNPEEIELRLSGIIDKQSSLFDYTYKYIRNIEFLNLSDTFSFSYIFDEVPRHNYFNLINSMLCE